VCPLRLALDSQAHLGRLKQINDRILGASHLTAERDGLELWDTPKGPYWIPKGNRYVLPFNLAEMEAHIYGSGEHFVRSGDVVLDCGASDGDFSRQALSAGAKLVVAIEISPASVECLRRNLAPEIAAGRAIVYPKGVWDKNDTLSLNVDDQNFAANSVVLHAPGAHATFQAQLTTIDQIVNELALSRVDFIKMDVEGAEVNALRGARETLLRFRPRLAIATEHKPDDETAIPNAVRAIKSDYQAECGYCAQSNGHIHPEVMYFY
jgi:FkbM family methyltransferase